jgi:hypothetical protein
MWHFLRYIGGLAAGVIVAAGMTLLLVLVLPRPHGPRVHPTDQVWTLVAYFFPVAALALGSAGVVIAARSRSGAMGESLRVVGGFAIGVIVAAGMTAVLALVLPRPHGPPDQAAGQAMGLMFCFFPLMALAFGIIGSFVVAKIRE